MMLLGITITTDFLITLISNNLFPIFITCFLLFRLEKSLNKLSGSITLLSKELNKIENYMEKTTEEIKKIKSNQEMLIRKMAHLD